MHISSEKSDQSAGAYDGDGDQMMPLSGQPNRFSFHMEINAKTTQVSPRNTMYLNAIDGGGRATQAMTAFGDLGLNARFKLIGLTDGSFAIQAPDGIHYVTADDGGGIEGGNALLTNQTNIQAWETFKIVDHDDGVYTIQTISGLFLGVGQGGVISTRISNPDAAPQIGYNARFEFIPVGLIKQSP